MVKQAKVNLVWQMILIFIPLGAIFAYYRINKLRKGLLLILLELAIVVTISIILGLVIGQMGLILSESEAITLGVLIEYPTYAIINVFFVYRWSKQWNDQIIRSQSTPESN